MKRLRRGSMLIQQVVLMTAASFVLLIAVSIIHQSMTAGRNFREGQNVSLAMRGLAKQFRRDVHLSVSRQLQGEDALSMTLFDQNIVTYQVDGSVVTRKEIEPASDKIASTNSYALGLQVSPKFSMERTAIMLEIRRVGEHLGRHSTSLRDLRIVSESVLSSRGEEDRDSSSDGAENE